MASLPDYNPNKPIDALKKENLNRVSAGLFEMGSTFKAFTTAMALDSGKVNMGSRFDARKALRIGGHTINDAEVPGFRVGGKTGTAEKVVNGRYSSDVRFNAFLATFPVDNPEYVVLVFVDEPKPEEGKKSATAGLNAAPVVGNIIRRSASVLGVQADFGNIANPLLIAD